MQLVLILIPLAITNMHAPTLFKSYIVQNTDSFTEVSSVPAQYTLPVLEETSSPALSILCDCPGRDFLDHESLDLVLESADLAHEVGGLVGGDAAGDDSAGHTAGAAKSHLAGDVNLRSLC